MIKACSYVIMYSSAG